MATAIVSPTNRFNTKLTDYSVPQREKSGTNTDTSELDALIVGAGFAGVFMLKTLRDRGYKTAIFEAGDGLGGVWRWNCYPGAAVDSEIPVYEFSWPEVWKTWTWSSNYPQYRELRGYFDHVDKVFDIKKDCSFNTVVTGASFDTLSGKWSVRTEDGRTVIAKYLILGTGFASKRHIPDWPGVDKFQGALHHSSFWPEEGIQVDNKRCAVIGTGASGVQLVQALGPIAGELKVFQRTPNLALPFNRRSLSRAEQHGNQALYPELFRLRETTFAGFHYDWIEKNTLDDNAEDREVAYEKAWQQGGFKFWLSLYKDHLMNAEANKLSYAFWAKKIRALIDDPRKRDILAPETMPYHFGIKRPSVVESYYEQFDRPTVDVIDIKKNGIKCFTETGITLEDGTHHEFDVIAVATGFDVSTGAMTQLGLESIKNVKLQDEWASGVDTYLGLTVSGYPNMFHLYGPHGPTLLSNGPSTVEIQGRWVADMLDKIQRKNIKYVNAKPEAATEWKKHIVDLNNMTLIPTEASSPFMGGSIPGKVNEPMSYAGGVAGYKAEIRAALDSMKGFEVVYR